MPTIATAALMVVQFSVVADHAPVKSYDARVREAVQRAINAVGVRADLESVRGASWNVKVLYRLDDVEETATGKYAVQFPDCISEELFLSRGGQQHTLARIVRGDVGWERPVSPVDRPAPWRPISEKSLIREYRNWLTQTRILFLPSEIRPENVSAVLMPDRKIDGKLCTCLKISGRDVPDTTVFYDASSGSLLSAEYPGNPGLLLEKVPVTNYFHQYEAVDKVLVPMKIDSARQGKIFRRVEVQSVAIKRTALDASLFSPPGK
jgi:hypothetical protein